MEEVERSLEPESRGSGRGQTAEKTGPHPRPLVPDAALDNCSCIVLPSPIHGLVPPPSLEACPSPTGRRDPRHVGGRTIYRSPQYVHQRTESTRFSVYFTCVFQETCNRSRVQECIAAQVLLTNSRRDQPWRVTYRAVRLSSLKQPGVQNFTVNGDVLVPPKKPLPATPQRARCRRRTRKNSLNQQAYLENWPRTHDIKLKFLPSRI